MPGCVRAGVPPTSTPSIPGIPMAPHAAATVAASSNCLPFGGCFHKPLGTQTAVELAILSLARAELAHMQDACRTPTATLPRLIIINGIHTACFGTAGRSPGHDNGTSEAVNLVNSGSTAGHRSLFCDILMLGPYLPLLMCVYRL